MSNLLVVEDDVEINGLLVRLLRNKGYEVDTAFSGSEGMMLLERSSNYDLILLDLMLPGMTGEEIITRLRSVNNPVPIIVISAKTDVDNKVSVLGLGADDFITKPFNNEEVLARIEAHLRRYTFSGTGPIHAIYKAKNIVLDRDQMEVYINDKPMPFTVIEYKILELLMTNPKKVFTKENLFKNIWNDEYYGNDNTVNVHISNLRSKIAKADPHNDYIKTVWGIGFKFIE